MSHLENRRRLPRIPQLPPAHHPHEVCDERQQGFFVAAQQGQRRRSLSGARLSRAQGVARRWGALLDQHSIFTRFVLPATHTAEAAPAEATPSARDTLRSKKPRAPQGPSPLALLCGHEDTLLALIADFVGVVRGRQLRNAREAGAMLIVMEEIEEAALIAIEEDEEDGDEGEEEEEDEEEDEGDAEYGL